MKYIKSNLLRTLGIILLVALIASCSKSEDPVNTVDTSFLTGKVWELQSVNMAGMEMTGQEMLADEGAEFQMTIRPDSTITYVDNMGMNPMNGKWKFQGNMTQFLVYGVEAGKSDLNTIVKLTSSELWFWHMDGNDKMTMRYKAK